MLSPTKVMCIEATGGELQVKNCLSCILCTIIKFCSNSLVGQ